ncbi:protein-disulfide reductase DsbD family protein [Arenimonas composti]|uniref:Thioredoxin domain-containing protein n=1 Tax=Arenimonas composti TR7-09 = DSM 18010 TaxID=1121013 RepID=A0A091B956_9GAMM|nr:protein-disulfide reductase DsbD [Arenimonas composti]KFN49198.1 hypothetical protein P873_12135 [Arenimonas composti TR7-09 = DSM 18010]
MNLSSRFALLLAALAWLAPVRAAVDEADLLPIDEAFALSAQASERGRIEFRWKIADGYYLYRHRTSVQPADGAFTPAGELQLPPGHAYTDEFFGDVETYRGELLAVQAGTAADGATAVTFRVRYQGCADVGVCYPPHQQVLTVALPAGAAVATGPADIDAALARLGGISRVEPLPGTAPAVAGAPLPEAQAFRFEAIVTAPDRLLLRFTPAPGYYLYRDRNDIAVGAPGARAGEPLWPAATPFNDAHFGDVQVYFDQVEVPLPLLRSAAGEMPATVTATFQGCQTGGICYPPMTRTVALRLPPADPASLGVADVAPVAGAGTFLVTLLLALLGGVILNLFPCVLPVLSLKVLGLAQSGESRAQARRQALWYTAGVLVSFAALGALALALRQAGLALGWGFQLQQPGVVAALALVMVGLGLSLSGVVTFGVGLTAVGDALTRRSGAAGDFFTGVLAVVVATPCTAPFMGGALAWAFAAPPVLALPVFLAMGLGLALPFLLIGFVPALASRLPKPGAWMETFKQFLAFPLYLTAVWLLWVLAKQRGADAVGLALVGAVVLALALWAWERLRWHGWLAKLPVLALAAVVVWLVAGVQQLPPPVRADAAAGADDAEVAPGTARPWSAERLAALRAEGRVVFVNMTADWCVTCKANERTVLSGDAFAAALERAGAAYLKGDWTDVDPAITAFLESHGAVGVPLYVVYPRQGEPVVLPTVLTEATVVQALDAAAR